VILKFSSKVAYLFVFLFISILLLLQEGRGSPDGADWTALCDLEESQGSDASPQNDSGFPPSHNANDEQGSKEENQDAKTRDGVKVLPFEFIALEACLEAACRSLDNEVYPSIQFQDKTLLQPFLGQFSLFFWFYCVCIPFELGEDSGARSSSSVG